MAASASRSRRRPEATHPAAAPLGPTRTLSATGRGGHADPLLHDRTRLGIVSALAGTDTLTFVELKNLLDITDGNLSVHARRLENAGYLTCTKSFEGRLPRTDYKLTAAGRKRLRQETESWNRLATAMSSALKARPSEG